MPRTRWVDGKESTIGREKPMAGEVDSELTKRMVPRNFNATVMDVWSMSEDFLRIQMCRSATLVSVKLCQPDFD